MTLELASVVEDGILFRTRHHVTFRFLRNTEKSPDFGSRFQQDIEPAGRYMVHNENPGELARGWESGTVTFERPLVLKFSDTGLYDATSWKARLAEEYGLTGLKLSKALMHDGFDGIVTVGVFEHLGKKFRDTREIVDLRSVATYPRQASEPYYHGSRELLEPGTILTPQPDGYAQRQYADGAEDNWVERAMEEGRPSNKLSRLESVFMLKLDADHPDLKAGHLFDQCGGYSDYIYEVEPLGPVEASDLHWYTRAAFIAKTPLAVKRAVNAYWNGKSAGFLFEYRTPKARVVRLVGGTKAPPETRANPRCPTRILGVPKCSVRGCGRDHYARGYCMRHYMLRRLHKSLRLDLKRDELAKDVKICRAKFCRRDAVVKGLCRKHATQVRVHGRLTPEREQCVERVCRVRGCGGDHAAAGLCMKHYDKRMRKNPSTGAWWLTPQLEARLHDMERKDIRCRTRLYGKREGMHVCQRTPFDALGLILDASEQGGSLVHGLVLYHGIPGGWPNVDPGRLEKPYFHWWIALDDGTIVDVASSQFGQRSPLVLPPGHPMQSLYVPEHPTAEELPSGYVPLVIGPKTRRRNSDVERRDLERLIEAGNADERDLRRYARALERDLGPAPLVPAYPEIRIPARWLPQLGPPGFGTDDVETIETEQTEWPEFGEVIFADLIRGSQETYVRVERHMAALVNVTDPDAPDMTLGVEEMVDGDARDFYTIRYLGEEMAPRRRAVIRIVP